MPDAAPRPTLLLVEDERTNLDMLVHTLQGDYDLQIAKSGTAALRRVADRRPDLILLDVFMPDLDGFAVFERLRADGVDVPVVFATGMAAPEDEERAFRMGAADYIVKPFNPVVVRARVARQLRLARLEAMERAGRLPPRGRSGEHGGEGGTPPC